MHWGLGVHMIGQQIAIFIDSGYLYKRLYRLTGWSVYKDWREFDIERFKHLLLIKCEWFNANARFLRIYWYDAVPRGQRPNDFQIKLSETDDIKLRLGRLQEKDNGDVEQKGVDLMLANDLRKLSQNGAISDALIFTGDSDLRAAVEDAQHDGVRVLLGMMGVNRSKSSVSHELYEEADKRFLIDWEEAFYFLRGNHTQYFAKEGIESRVNFITARIERLFSEWAENRFFSHNTESVLNDEEKFNLFLNDHVAALNKQFTIPMTNSDRNYWSYKIKHIALSLHKEIRIKYGVDTPMHLNWQQ